MPLLKITSNISISDAEKKNALQTISKTAAELLEKSEDYVMTCWTSSKMTMGGSEAPALFLDLYSIRLQLDDSKRLCKELCERISLAAEVRLDRIYIHFHDIEASHWGWNGKTFGD